ncbi:hypothetical protein [Pseudemcibacter aquimaris]|uniref:hypothetical protein n=1 Tax=Pseudemcibacter aquimaris TaxID=2857064 RepID=UPI0020121217|nr:hypothetical protein [Pseudemcibacter aquimaris]MCC3861388.1 hypothetical protein [Pseudemcibacter aquimaris]WDU58158.1 hypothetical protein KW060_13270 [Pseudemcibacter aquimaris]
MANEKSNNGDKSKPQNSMIKKEVPVELILHDGTHMQGSVNISVTTNPHNAFEELPDFFHLNRESNDYYLINKAYVVVCKIPEH